MATNQITGGAFVDSEGNPLANGYLIFELNQDEQTTTTTSTQFTIFGNSTPWNVTGSINTAFNYHSPGSGSAPVTIAVTPGQVYRVQYVSGLANAGGSPSVDSGGYPGTNGNDVAGQYPGVWIQEAVNAGSAIGAFTTSGGQILLGPFHIGLDSGYVVAPPTAAFLSMGNNDGGTYSDNSGSWTMKYTVTNPIAQCSQRTIQVPLDSNGNIVTSPVYKLWPNDVLTPSGSFYKVSAYTAKGQLVWGPNAQSILSSPSPYVISAWNADQIL